MPINLKTTIRNSQTMKIYNIYDKDGKFLYSSIFEYKPMNIFKNGEYSLLNIAIDNKLKLL